MATAETEAIEYDCDQGGTLLKSTVQSLGKKRRCPACQSYTRVNARQNPQELPPGTLISSADLFQNAQEPAPTVQENTPAQPTAATEAPNTDPREPVFINRPTPEVTQKPAKAAADDQNLLLQKINDTQKRSTILADHQTPFARKVMICLEWMLALALALLGMTVLGGGLALILYALTGFQMPG